MTSLSRSRLGLTLGQAKLTAQELNRRLAKAGVSQEVAVVPQAWEAEWDEA